MRHASFFSGVGGLDLGFERAGLETVSVCEIDPYASSVLAERFPSAPNLGSITEVSANDVPEADIWSGGFPCQDLSVAGKRAGFAGARSSLAFTFLNLVEQRRPRWIVLENVPGLLSSNHGRDFGRLLYEMDALGYGVAWRVLDARFFGVAQRRRRVFIIGSLGSDRASEVLAECEGCERHPATSLSTWQGVASGAQDGSGIARGIRASLAKRGERGDGSDALIVGQATNADGVRAANGMARRMDNLSEMETVPAYGEEFADTLAARDWKRGVGNQDIGRRGYLGITREIHLGSLTGGGSDSPQSERIFSEDGAAPTLDTGRAVPQVFRNSARVSSPDSAETWVDDGVANTLNSFDVGDVRTTHAVLSFPSRFGSNANVTEDQAQSIAHSAGSPAVFGHYEGKVIADEALLPPGLDGHRYRCVGNGVVSNVAEWIGRRIVAVDAMATAEEVAGNASSATNQEEAR